MAELTSSDKLILEKVLGMQSGYVLDFSDRSFREFVQENTGLNIEDEIYQYSSGSKANRLRAFWAKENNLLVGKLIKELMNRKETVALLSDKPLNDSEKTLIQKCEQIARKLINESTERSCSKIA